jgi:FdhD protein
VSTAAIPVPINRVKGSIASRVDDRLTAEEPLEIRLGQQSLSMTKRTPGNDFELASGFLLSEGIISNASQIPSLGCPGDGSLDVVVVELDGESRIPVPAQRNFTITFACGLRGKASLRDLEMNSCPALPRDDIQISPDVIGRYNAVYKLVRAALLERRTPLRNSLLSVSGRASFEARSEGAGGWCSDPGRRRSFFEPGRSHRGASGHDDSDWFSEKWPLQRRF